MSKLGSLLPLDALLPMASFPYDTIPPPTQIDPRQTQHYLDMDLVEREFWEHWEATGRPNPTKGIEAMFMGFTKKKYGQVKYGKK